MARFSMKEKLKHYTNVANGTEAVKADSKYSPAEQKAYARGQRDARNESNRIYASKNSTPEQKESYRLKKARERYEYLSQKEKNKSKKK